MNSRAMYNNGPPFHVDGNRMFDNVDGATRQQYQQAQLQ